MAEQKKDVEKTLKEIVSKPVKIVAISGSLRKTSFNTGILRYLQSQKIEAVEFEVVAIDKLPMFNQDLEHKDDQTKDPEEVQAFRKKIREADGVLFATPEYNFGMTGPLKNAIDWASRRGNAWKGKPYVLFYMYISIIYVF